MKLPMRQVAAIDLVRPYVERAVRGTPLPKHTDADFESFKNAVAVLSYGHDFAWLGKIAFVELGLFVKNELEERDTAKAIEGAQS